MMGQRPPGERPKEVSPTPAPVRDQETGRFAKVEPEPGTADVPAEPDPAPAAAVPAQKAPDASTVPAPGTKKDEGEPQTAHQLRKAYAQTKAELEELRKAPAKTDPAVIKERDELKTQLQQERQARESMENRIKFLDYSKSPEFEEKYMAPLQKAGAAAMKVIKELTVTTEDGLSRPATREDFVEILNMPLQAAWDRADQLFGRLAPEIMRRREDIRALDEAKDEAIETYKTKGTEFETQRKTQAEQHNSKLRQVWSDANAEIAAQDPTLYGLVEGDEEGNSLWSRASQVADAVFDPTRQFPPEQRVRMTAMIKNQAAALPRTIHRLKTAEARVAELEAELADYRKSEPPGGGGEPASGGAIGADDLEDPEKMLRGMVTDAGRRR